MMNSSFPNQQGICQRSGNPVKDVQERTRNQPKADERVPGAALVSTFTAEYGTRRCCENLEVEPQ